MLIPHLIQIVDDCKNSQNYKPWSRNNYKRINCTTFEVYMLGSAEPYELGFVWKRKFDVFCTSFVIVIRIIPSKFGMSLPVLYQLDENWESLIQSNYLCLMTTGNNKFAQKVKTIWHHGLSHCLLMILLKCWPYNEYLSHFFLIWKMSSPD